MSEDIHFGWIVDSSPAEANYRIQIPKEGETVEAIPVSSSGASPGASKDLTSFAPGDRVLVTKAGGRFYLLGSAAPEEYDPQGTLSDRSPRSGKYPAYLQHAKNYPQTYDGGDTYGTPDSWGKIYPSGVQIMSNLWEASIDAGTWASVSTSLIDNMTRIIGLNLDLLSGGSAEKRISDAGGYNEIHAITPYLWEAKSGCMYGLNIYGGGSVAGDVMPVPRFMQLRGYAGDLDTTIVQAPTRQSGDDPEVTRVLERRLGHDGSYMVRSSNSIELGQMGPWHSISLQHPSREQPSSPAGMSNPTAGTLGDYVSGPQNYGLPPSDFVDRKLHNSITVDDGSVTESYAGPTALNQVPNADYQSMVARKESNHNLDERRRARAASHLLQAHYGVYPDESEDLFQMITADQRGRVKIIAPRTKSLMKICQEGSISAIAAPQKWKVGRNSIAGYGKRINLIGGHIGLAGEQLNTTTYHTQIAATERISIDSQQTVVNNPVRGRVERGEKVGKSGIFRVEKLGEGGWSTVGEVSYSGLPLSGAQTLTGMAGSSATYRGVIIESENENRLETTPFSGAGEQLYKLKKCGGTNTFWITNDLAQYTKQGKIVLELGPQTDGEEDTVCYKIVETDADPSESKQRTARSVTVKAAYGSCPACQSDCWDLTPCGGGIAITVQGDLASYEGQVVKWEGICYEVTASETCNSPEMLSGIESSYNDCNSCKNSCFKLQECGGGKTKYVSGAEHPKGNFIDLGNYAVVNIGGTCYTVTSVTDSTNCPSADVVEVNGLLKWKLVPCGSGNVIYPGSVTDEEGNQENLSNYSVVRLSNNKCYQVEAITDPCSQCGQSLDVTLLAAYGSCSDCTFYILSECGGSGEIITYTDLSGLGYSVGDVLALEGEKSCYEITGTTSDGTDAVAVTPTNNFPSCSECNTVTLVQDCPEECNGAGAADLVIRDATLANNIGKYVEIDGKCYTIQKGGTGPYVTRSYKGPYDTCEECLENLGRRSETVLEGVQIDGTDLVFPRKKLIVEGNRIVAVCEMNPLRIKGTDCS